MKQTLLTIFFSLSTAAAMAQGFVTELKVVAVQKEDSLAPRAVGYYGAGNYDLDFRKGKGGGYVFVVFKNTTDPNGYITDVKVKKRDDYGHAFNEDGKAYKPAPFYQAQSQKDNDYRGGLNGRNYLIYGGAYPKQDHVYYTYTGNKDFNQRVLQKAEVKTSRPTAGNNQSVSGPHAGGDRYFLFTWHKHQSLYRSLPSESIEEHEHYCNLDGCKLTIQEPHHFPQMYGNDLWMQFTDKDTKYDCEAVHYKKCKECGQIVTEAHNFATYSGDWQNHNKRCLVCGYVINANHPDFGKQPLPVDENSHIIYCPCGFLKKLPHSLDHRREVKLDCEYTLVQYTCNQCYHTVYFEEPGVGHDYDANGFCTREGCLHPYKRPAVEYPQGSTDSTYVVKTFGNLYWISDYVNNRRPKTHFRLDNDLIADSLIQVPWHPIGDADSTAFQGTFDGNGYGITMLQTEEPVAGCGPRGLFGAIGKGGVVKNVGIAACNMRGWDNIGAIAGVNNGTIEDCHVVFSLMSTIGTGKNLGGICGLNRGTISKCTTEGNVWVGGVRDYAGGICGTNEGGTLLGNTTAAICGSGSDATLPEAASEQ